MKLLILHLSDIHLRTANNPAVDKLLQISPAVQNVDSQIEGIVVVASGDIAWSGKQEEYDVANEELIRLQGFLREKTGIANVPFVFVPGNHDCDFSSDGSARDTIIDSIRKRTNAPIGSSILSICCVVQAPFFKFLDAFPTTAPTAKESPLYYEYRWSHGGRCVLFRCYNTAWLSQLHEEQGALYYPEQYLGIEPKEPSDFVVSVFHHPYNWLASDNARAFREHIEVTSDVILTGHEHESDHYEKHRFQGEVNAYFEGGVLQEHKEPNVASFNAFWIDLTAQKQRVMAFSWNGTFFDPEDISGGWVPYSRGSRTAGRDFVVAESFQSWLDDPGAAFSHPAKSNLTLGDIFVAPSLKEFKLNDKKDPVYGPNMDGEEFLKTAGARRRIIVLSQQQAGKTTLAKVLFATFYGKHLTPVLIRGDDINSVDAEKFEKLVDAAFQRQYRNPMLPLFAQLDRDKVVVIVDDFDHTKLNANGRLKLLGNIHERFLRICILGDDVLKIEELAFGKLSTVVLNEYAQFQLMEFGHLLRSRLIEKWYDIGSEYAANPEELAHKVHHAENLINTLLGRSYLPAFPIFILSFLQAAESANPLNTDVGTYGSLYEVLIMKALATKSKAFNIDLKATYLSELAYWLFSERKREVSEQEWMRFHDLYRAKFKIHPSRTGLRKEFEDAGMIDFRDGQFSFRHGFAYYYFVARYFKDNIHEDKVRQEVAALCDELQKEEHTRIWLFLTHLSKNPFIVDTLLQHAKRIFSEHKASEFGDDVSFITALYDRVPEITLEERDFRERKDARLRKLDEVKQALGPEKDSDEASAEEETNETLKLLFKLNLALRTVEVLGQLVKNFPGSLVGDAKFQLVLETYMLGLRTLEVLLGTVRANVEEFVRWFAERVREQHPEIESSEELNTKIKQSLFWLIELSCFGMIKRISHAIGHSSLDETYEEVRKTCDTNAVKLIDMSVKLDNVGFPENDLLQLNKQFTGKVFCERLLRHLVVHHLYMFQTRERVKQKVCAELNIPIKRLRGIDVTSAAEKRLPNIRGSG